MATSKAARSTPVCPPEMILSAFTVAAVSDRRPRATPLIAGRNDVRPLDHQDDGAFRRACSMAHTFRHDKTLAWRKVDYAIFEIDKKSSVEHEKKFIDIVVLMPVIFALNHCHPNN